MHTSSQCLAVAFSQVKVRGGMFRASGQRLFAHHTAHLHNSLPQDTADAQKFVWIHKAMEGEKKKKIPVGLPNALTPHLGWEDLKPQGAGGQESTLQRQHNMLALFGGASLGVCPWLLAEVGEMVLQPDPELLVSCEVLYSSVH